MKRTTSYSVKLLSYGMLCFWPRGIHWAQAKLASIFQMTFWRLFFFFFFFFGGGGGGGMTIAVFWFKFQWYFFLKGPINNILALVQITSWCWNSRQAIIWTNGGLVDWCKFMLLGLEMLTLWLVDSGLPIAKWYSVLHIVAGPRT